MAGHNREPASPPPPPRLTEADVPHLIELAEEELDYIGGALVRRGAKYVPRVRDFTWDPDERIVTCAVQGSARDPYTVTIEIPSELPADFLFAFCSCPYSNDEGPCKHVAAAVTRLLRMLKDPTDPFRAQMVAGQAPQREVPSLPKLLRWIDELVEQGNAAATAVVQAPNRLAWRLKVGNVQNRVKVLIRPFLQQRNARTGSWSIGRQVRWERLLVSGDVPTSPADAAPIAFLARWIASQGYIAEYYGETDRRWVDFLKTFVGHPLVFWEDQPRQTVEVQLARLGFVADDTPSGLVLVPAIAGEPLNPAYVYFPYGGDACYVDVARDRVYVLDGSGRHERTFRELFANPAVIPRGKEELFLQRLPALDAVAPVKLPPRLEGERIAADTRVHVLCNPVPPAGIEVALRTRPTAEGEYFVPGAGPGKLTGLQEKKMSVVERDLAGESSRAKVAAAALGLDFRPPRAECEWLLPTDEEAVDFLARLRAQLPENCVVEWPKGLEVSFLGDLSPKSLRVEISDKHDWFGLAGSIELEGQSFPLVEFLAAIRSGQQYVRLGPAAWARIEGAFRDRLLALADAAQPRKGKLELDLTAAPLVADLVDDAAVTLKQCAAWKRVVARMNEAAAIDPEPPVTLTAELRDYQLEGYKWLRRLAHWGVGACLADDMGLGKTVQALALLIDRMEEGPTLVVAPTSVGFNWVREAERFAPTLHPILYRETDRDDCLASLSEGDLVITSYGLLLRDQEKLAKVDWGTFVLDEAQFIKNSQTKTAQAVRSVPAKWRLAMTGTPLENHLGELWSLFRAICPGLFGSWERFRERFAEPIERQKDHARRQSLSRLVRPFILRRTKSEVLAELPGRTEVERTAVLSSAERRAYEDARLAALVQLASGENAGTDQRFAVLAALTRLRQLACHPKLVDATWTQSSAKLDLFLEVVDELREGGHRALVFSQFTQHLALIRAALDERQISYQYLDGQTTAKERARRVDAFQRGEGEFFLISLKAGGTGLNLTAADYVIHMDPWWNPAVEDQATDRAHRIGQTRPVTVYRLVTEGTIEQQILALHADKRDLVAGVLEGTDQAARLSTADLISLIRSGGRAGMPAAGAAGAEGAPGAPGAPGAGATNDPPAPSRPGAAPGESPAAPSKVSSRAPSQALPNGVAKAVARTTSKSDMNADIKSDVKSDAKGVTGISRKRQRST